MEPRAPCPKPKAGLTAFAPGSAVTFELPISPSLDAHPGSRGGDVTAAARDAAFRMPSGDAMLNPWNATLTLWYLSSYKGMGIVVAQCVRGCDCAPVTLDAHRGVESDDGSSNRLISVWERSSWRVQLRAPACALQLSLQNQTRSDGTKFKLSSMTLRWIQ